MIEIIFIIQVIIVIGGPLFLLYINKRLGGYASEVGKITAISKKINEVVEQQEKITKVTEETKADIAHLAWKQKESLTIKRHKLEKYLEKVFEAVELTRDMATDPKGKVLPITLIAKLTTLQKLYLPELEAENRKFTDVLNEYESILYEYSLNKIDINALHNKSMKMFANLAIGSKDITSKSQNIIDTLLDINNSHNKTS